MRFYFHLVFAVAVPCLGAQNFVRVINPFEVKDGSAMLNEPFGGGVYVPKAEIVDMDGNGVEDLLIVQIDGRITLFRFDGLDYRWVTDNFDSLNVNQWARFVDIDADGDLDLFANHSGSFLSYYENVGSASLPVFALRDSLVTDSLGQSILSENQSIPEFCDIDGDGDLDLFTGRSIGSLALYENCGTATHPKFVFVTDHFANILIITGAKSSVGNRHGASSIRFTDFDFDGDKDLFWGDFFSSRMYYLENTGTSQLPVFDSITSRNFPGGLTTLGFNAPNFGDLNQDGRTDLLVSVLYRDQDLDNLWLYQRDAAGELDFATKNFLKQVDVGRQSSPVLADLTGDGLEDLILGSYGYGIFFYRNTGSVGNWRLERDSIIVQSVLQDSFVLSPTFGDLDADGDLDCLLGSFDGKIAYLENVGSAMIPSFVVASSNFYGIDIGNYSSPALSDLDADGDLDLLIGDGEGRIFIFPNTGTITSAQFSSTASTTIVCGEQDAVPELYDYDGDGDEDLFVGVRDGRILLFENEGTSAIADFVLRSVSYGGIKTTQNAVPRFVDADADGDADLFVGNVKGGLEFYLAGLQKPILEKAPPLNLFVGIPFTYHVHSIANPPAQFQLLTSPSALNLNEQTGVITWLPTIDEVGQHVATLRAYNIVGSDTTTLIFNIQQDFQGVRLFQNRPNPAVQTTTIPFELPSAMRVKIIVYNMLGQQVRLISDTGYGPGDHVVTWDLKNDRGHLVGDGIYVYGVLTDRHMVFRKLSILK